MTYRFVGHSRSDPGKYRKPGELDEWKKRDPLILGRRALEERYGIESERCDEIDAEVAKQLEEIVERGPGGAVPGSRRRREGVQVMADASETIEYRVAIREAIGGGDGARRDASSSSARTWRSRAACSR